MVQREHRERVRGMPGTCRRGVDQARRSLRFPLEDLYGPRAGGACSEFGFASKVAVMSANIIFASVAPIWGGGFPRRGWTSHLVQDLGDLSGSCEACGTAIRYVHHLSHPAHAGKAVGVECAGELTGDYGIPARHAKRLRAKKKFPEYFEHTWTLLANGVEGAWTRVGDMYVTIKKPGHRWIAVFEPIGPGRKHSYAPGGRALESTAQKALVFLKGNYCPPYLKAAAESAVAHK